MLLVYILCQTMYTSLPHDCGRVLSLCEFSCGQEWGAECSSALFELPHFAVELLIVLPTVQIICSRLRILAQPQLRVVVCIHFDRLPSPKQPSQLAVADSCTC
jgi:hypothetical protein